MLEGWKREKGPRQEPRQPLSLGILKGLSVAWGGVCTSDYEICLFHTTSLVAFFAALRFSELVASSRTDKSARVLPWGDVWVQSGRLAITVWVSKMVQAGKGQVVYLDACEDRDLCPVRAVEWYIAVRGEAEGFFFQHFDGVY